MKIFLLLTLALTGAGCAPSANAESGAAPEVVSFSEPTLKPVRVVRVSQYENRMPADTLDKKANLVTLIEIEAATCRTLRQDDVKVLTKASSSGQRLAFQIPKEECAAPAKQILTISTSAVARGAAITIANPVLIETLPAAE